MFNIKNFDQIWFVTCYTRKKNRCLVIASSGWSYRLLSREGGRDQTISVRKPPSPDTVSISQQYTSGWQETSRRLELKGKIRRTTIILEQHAVKDSQPVTIWEGGRANLPESDLRLFVVRRFCKAPLHLFCRRSAVGCKGVLDDHEKSLGRSKTLWFVLGGVNKMAITTNILWATAEKTGNTTRRRAHTQWRFCARVVVMGWGETVFFQEREDPEEPKVQE